MTAEFGENEHGKWMKLRSHNDEERRFIKWIMDKFDNEDLELTEENFNKILKEINQ